MKPNAHKTIIKKKDKQKLRNTPSFNFRFVVVVSG